MYLRDKTVFIAGLLMVLVAFCLIIVLASSIAGGGEKDPFERDEVAEYLTEIYENRTELQIAGAVGIVIDGFLGIALAGAVYVLFRDRSRLLATLAFAGLLGQSIISVGLDANGILLTFVAEDYVKGGVGGAAANDPAALELGRYLGMVSLIFFNVIFTVLGVGLIALGLLIARSPIGAVNPPRWLGWVALVAGVSAELAWLVVAAEPFFVFFPLQFLASLVFLIGTGVWLLMHQDLQPADGPTAAV